MFFIQKQRELEMKDPKLDQGLKKNHHLPSASIYIYIYIHTHIYIYTYIYIHIYKGHAEHNNTIISE